MPISRRAATTGCWSTGHAFLDDAVAPGADGVRPVLAMAHRGGAGHPDLVGAENTQAAFAHAHALGYRFLETDVHLTRDGVLVAVHDATLDRVTDRRGAIDRLRWSEVALARVAGAHPVPRLEDLLEGFPDCAFNIDLKGSGTGPALAELLARTGAEDRTCVGSFDPARLERFRWASGGRVATAASPPEVAAFLINPLLPRLARLLTRGRVAVLAVPPRRGPLPVVTRSLVRTAHRAGAQVHVWTVDDAAEIDRLADLGVDGLITDRTDVCRDVLIRRGQWRRPPTSPSCSPRS